MKRFRSKALHGKVWHRRNEPVVHEFSYPMVWYALDLDELETLDRELPGFGLDRFAPLSIRSKDYLGPSQEGASGHESESESIKSKLLRFLTQAGCADGVTRVELVTGLRFFGYVFNPVSVYYAYRDDDSLRCAVAEVNNTFGEKHLYILDGVADEATEAPPNLLGCYHADKAFHVSPFYNMEGRYQFNLTPTDGKVCIQIDRYHLSQKPARDLPDAPNAGDVNAIPQRLRQFEAGFTGTAKPLGGRDVYTSMLRRPLTPILTTPRIIYQAAKLKFSKRLPVFTKPHPSSPMTIQIPHPTRRQQLAHKVVSQVLSKIQADYLHLTLPDGREQAFGAPDAAFRAEMRVADWRVFTRLIRDGNTGFSEAWMDGDFETDDLTKLLAIFVRNQEAMTAKGVTGKWVSRRFDQIKHLMRPNTIKGSRKNISAHYDLSNDFYQSWLDRNLMYSSGIFLSPEDGLAEAQVNKNRRLIEEAQICAEDHVLEIGCGWGGFAIQAVQETGCRVTGITISQAQHDLAVKRIREAGLENRIDIVMCDYRKVTGSFDKIVSIEMLEAVGHAYFPSFFEAIERVLKPNGLVAIQVITIPEQRYDSYRRNADFIQKYIFPGGCLPSIEVLGTAMRKHSKLTIEGMENFGIHYSKTLKLWREGFEENWGAIEGMGFDERFRRMWLYYLCYCEAGFSERYISVVQLLLTRSKNAALPGVESLEVEARVDADAPSDTARRFA